MQALSSIVALFMEVLIELVLMLARLFWIAFVLSFTVDSRTEASSNASPTNLLVAKISAVFFLCPLK